MKTSHPATIEKKWDSFRNSDYYVLRTPTVDTMDGTMLGFTTEQADKMLAYFNAKRQSMGLAPFEVAEQSWVDALDAADAWVKSL